MERSQRVGIRFLLLYPKTYAPTRDFRPAPTARNPSLSSSLVPKPLYDTYMPMLTERNTFLQANYQYKGHSPSYQPIKLSQLADTVHSTDIRLVQPPIAYVRYADVADSEIYVEQTFEMRSAHREWLVESSGNASERTLEAKQETRVPDLV
ncbi:MAG: hypothetical protein L6R42_006721 [Xanthoria sp. 1 TBL-2021]|nr:MAG: hypothetical protein L6R42_006721 [Xanthoria sp. 1 TBL-2021]